jgi:HK97 family phage prohead protease
MSDGFYRRAVAFDLRDDSHGDGFTLEGYAAVFNSPTLINDWDGEYEETIAPGAFKRTIAGGSPVLQFDHGQHPVLGSIPIGSIQTLSEDSRGLFVRARLFDNWMTEPVRQAIDARAIDGMSFRFQVPQGKDMWTEPEAVGGLRTRLIREVRLFELGPVVFPAYRDTTVALRSLASAVPGLTLTLSSDTSEEPAAETRGTSEEPVEDSTDPTPPRHSDPSTKAEREALARRIRFDRRND